jgi:hypothetical protein
MTDYVSTTRFNALLVLLYEKGIITHEDFIKEFIVQKEKEDKLKYNYDNFRT